MMRLALVAASAALFSACAETPKPATHLVSMSVSEEPLFPTGAAAELGPVVEVHLAPTGTWDRKSFIDFDSGRIFSKYQNFPPTVPRIPEAYDYWIRYTGIDADGSTFITNPEETDYFKCTRVFDINGYDLRAWQIDNARWDNIDAELKSGKPLDLGKFRSHNSFMPLDAEGKSTVRDGSPRTYLFITREGARGILQYTGSSAADASAAIRYRMFQHFPKNPLTITLPYDPSDPSPQSGAMLLEPFGATSLTSSHSLPFQFPHAPPTYSFAAEVSVTLASPETKEPCALDLDTGKTFATDVNLLRTDPNHPHWLADGTHDWLAKNHADLIAQPEVPDHALWTLSAADMRLLGVSREAYSTLTAAQAVAILNRSVAVPRQDFVTANAPSPSPQAYLFSTREGAIGLIMATGGTVSPQTITVQYKLITSP